MVPIPLGGRFHPHGLLLVDGGVLHCPQAGFELQCDRLLGRGQIIVNVGVLFDSCFEQVIGVLVDERRPEVERRVLLLELLLEFVRQVLVDRLLLINPASINAS